MMTDYEQFHHRVYGVDFSGAINAGQKIWVSAGTIEDDLLFIQGCDRIAAFADVRPDREECLKGLRHFVGKQTDAVFGLDFPFGLPRKVIVDSTDWLNFILSFPQNYANPQEFRARCLALANNRELKRYTERIQKTPWSAYNLRLYKQSFYGIGHLLAPLVRQQLVCVLPMQQPQASKPWLLEVCPASTLKKLALNRPYKRKNKSGRTARGQILETLEATGELNMTSVDLRSKVIGDSEGDALDSILAALAAFRALQSPAVLLPDLEDAYQVEGYVYA